MDFSGVRVQSFVPTASVSLCTNGDIITQPEPFMLATAFAATANGTRLQKSRGSSSAKTTLERCLWFCCETIKSNSGLFSPSVRFVCADVNTVITAKQLHRDHLEEVVLARSQTDYEACLWWERHLTSIWLHVWAKRLRVARYALRNVKCFPDKHKFIHVIH